MSPYRQLLRSSVRWRFCACAEHRIVKIAELMYVCSYILYYTFPATTSICKFTWNFKVSIPSDWISLLCILVVVVSFKTAYKPNYQGYSIVKDTDDPSLKKTFDLLLHFYQNHVICCHSMSQI